MESSPKESQSRYAAFFHALDDIETIPALNLYKNKTKVQHIEDGLLENNARSTPVAAWAHQLSHLHKERGDKKPESLATIFNEISEVEKLKEWYQKLMQSRSLLNDFDTICEEHTSYSLKQKVGDIANTLEVLSEVIRDRLEKLQPSVLLINIVNINNTQAVRDEDLKKIFLEFDRVARKDNLKNVTLLFDSELSDSTKLCIYLVRAATRLMKPDCEYKKKLLQVMDSYLINAKYKVTQEIAQLGFAFETLTPLFDKGVVRSCCDALKRVIKEEKAESSRKLKLTSIQRIITTLVGSEFDYTPEGRLKNLKQILYSL